MQLFLIRKEKKRREEIFGNLADKKKILSVFSTNIGNYEISLCICVYLLMYVVDMWFFF